MGRKTYLIIAALLMTGAVKAEELKEGYYKGPILFHYYPAGDSPREIIGRFGPVGLSLELLQPAFTMRITGVEEGSPAAATGKLKQGQYIESINGQVLKEIDPRVILGNLITEAEAKDGKMVMMIKETRESEAYPVTVQLPVLGAYSETWPVNCEKSDAIVRNMADYLDRSDTMGWGAALFLLSTGEEKDLDVVRRWFKTKLSADSPGFPWSIGYTGPAICEYYLRTGDKSVLLAIQSRADYLKRTIYNGSWMGRGGASFGYMAGGHMNAAGAHCVTFLMMAKECGVDVDEHTLQSSLRQFFKYAGRGNVPYGDAFPEGGFTDNGRVGKLAFAMQAAANLSPDGETSIYAKARDISATKAFYSTSWLFHGHTGGGIGELWRGASMGLMKDKRPKQYRSFMDERRWMYELARTHEGAFGWGDGTNVNYTQVNSGKPGGNYIPLIYTLPRKQLRLFGAPPTKYSKTYNLPERPWGTPADDAFYSLTPGKTASGTQLDIDTETIRTGASRALFDKMSAPDATEDSLRQYALHIDHTIRASAVGQIGKRGWDHLFLALLKSDDPRGRHAGVSGVAGKPLTDEVVTLLARMVGDPDESWWVVQQALKTLGKATVEQLAPHVDVFEKWLAHDDWWMRAAAMEALTPLALDKGYCERILPKIGKVMATNQRPGLNGPFGGLVRRLEGAEADVRLAAVEAFARTYADYPDMIAAPGGQDMANGTDYMLRHIARGLADIPGGFDALYRVSQKRFPEQTLPHLELYMNADTSTFSPELKKTFEPLLRDQIIWQFVANNRANLDKEQRANQPGKAMSELVNLYQKAGVTDYDWKLWGPRRDKIEWQYTTYDPPEEKIWERGGERGGRYRQVSWPQGAENWTQPGFDARKAGWETGFAPFAHNDGKLAPVGGCTGDHHYCGCGNPPNTFWEKEVLLMRARLDLPAMRPGYAYRLLVGGRSHVGSGEGSDVWINGTRKEDRRKTDPSLSGVGKRQGGKPWGFGIDNALRKQFTGEPVTLAATGFLPIHKSGVKRNYQAFWFEEMLMPTLGETEILQSMRVTPLLTAAWQSSLEDADKFRFDGTFKANPGVAGRWEQLGQVAAVEDFDPAARPRLNRNARFQTLTFKPDGRTDDRLTMYSGELLLDLRGNEALAMTVKDIDGAPYLFIETGGFKEDHPGDWSTSYTVMKRGE
ncbi:MAG: DUF6288 domain-containing protein [Lentisphaeria bacterium]|nr:DUF6288 domain-containing protein [Lentisphaeria bacterium]